MAFLFFYAIINIKLKEGMRMALITCPECGKEVSDKSEFVYIVDFQLLIQNATSMVLFMILKMNFLLHC